MTCPHCAAPGPDNALRCAACGGLLLTLAASGAPNSTTPAAPHDTPIRPADLSTPEAARPVVAALGQSTGTPYRPAASARATARRVGPALLIAGAVLLASAALGIAGGVLHTSSRAVQHAGTTQLQRQVQPGYAAQQTAARADLDALNSALTITATAHGTSPTQLLTNLLSAHPGGSGVLPELGYAPGPGAQVSSDNPTTPGQVAVTVGHSTAVLTLGTGAVTTGPGPLPVPLS